MINHSVSPLRNLNPVNLNRNKVNLIAKSFYMAMSNFEYPNW